MLRTVISSVARNLVVDPKSRPGVKISPSGRNDSRGLRKPERICWRLHKNLIKLCDLRVSAVNSKIN